MNRIFRIVSWMLTVVLLCAVLAAGSAEEQPGNGYVIHRDSRIIEQDGEYTRYYLQGVELFEAGKYAEAIEAFKNCLVCEPEDLYAIFEIAEAHISMYNYEEAKDWLTKARPWLNSDEFIARWLRRLGFIAIEETDYELGYALYVYSLEFEQTSRADQELKYIRRIAPDTKQFNAAEAVAYLEEYGISFARQSNDY